MKNVLFVILGIDFSGAEKVLLDYLRNEPKVNPIFLTVFKGKVTRVLEKEDLGKVYSCNLNFSRILFNILPFVYFERVKYFVERILQKEEITVVYFNNTHEVMLANKFLRQKKDCVSVGHIHDMKSSIRSFIKKLYIQSSLKKLDKSITVSHACQKSWRFIDHVIYNGIELMDNSVKITQFKKIGFIGNLSKRKGFDIYQKIAKLLKQSYDFSAVLKSDSKRAGDLCILYNLTNTQISEYLKSIDCLIVCSRHDPLPTVVLEAFAHGVICIGSSVDGIPEMIDNVNLISVNNIPHEYKNILNYINGLSLEERERIITNQYNAILNNFSINEKTKKINALLGVI